MKAAENGVRGLDPAELICRLDEGTSEIAGNYYLEGCICMVIY